MNTIAERIADFLKEFLPFKVLSIQELTTVALSIRVISLEKNKTLFKIDDVLHDSFYVVASGVVNLTVISDSEESLLNKCVAGDVFGLRPFFAKNNYMMTAKAREDCIIYAIPIDSFRPFVAQNSEVLNFLLESFANNTSNPNDIENRGKLLSDNVVFTSKPSVMQYYQSLSYNKMPLKVFATDNIQNVAKIMTDNMVDNVIITELDLPLGIVTDADMRSKIVTGKYGIDSRIDKIMTSPVITVDENISLAEAQLIMLKNNVSHLCVTQDGSDKTIIKGIITQNDLIVAQASNPGVLIKEIKRSADIKELKKIRSKLSDLVQNSITKKIPLINIMNIASEINLAIVKRIIELLILELGSPPARFAWLCIGSQGRKEQLLYTDQDSLLIFEDIENEKYKIVKEYFLKLAKNVTSCLEKIGYPACPNGHIASNMKWCNSLTEWKKQYSIWMNTPGELNSGIRPIFFDYEIAYGESKIEEALTDHIFKNVVKNNLFYDFLGNDALRKPAPLSFFKKFNLEEEGVNKDKFDIKTRALLPLIDSARLLVLSQNIKGFNNTYLRFKQLAITDSKNAEIYLNCAEAFENLFEISIIEGLKNDNSGQFVNIDELSKIEKENLKNNLMPMKDLEDLIKGKFQLTQFS